MATIKKKIELYVSENTGNTKTTGYYRIPLKGDSLPFNKETNLFKNCVRFYAKVAGDIVYYVVIGKIPYYVQTSIGMDAGGGSSTVQKGEVSEELFSNTVPEFPSELLNNNESFFMTDILGTKFNSKLGFDYINDSNQSTDELTRDSLFGLNNAIISDEYLNLLEFVPSNWIQLNSIDDIISDIKQFMNSGDNGIIYPYDIDDSLIFKYYYFNTSEFKVPDNRGDRSIISINKEPNLEVGLSKANLTNSKDARYLIMNLPELCDSITIDTTEMTGKVRFIITDVYQTNNANFSDSILVNSGESIMHKFNLVNRAVIQLVFENPTDASKLKITRNKFDLIPGKTFTTITADDVSRLMRTYGEALYMNATKLTDNCSISSTSTLFGNDNLMLLTASSDFSYGTQKINITDINTEANFAKIFIFNKNTLNGEMSMTTWNKTNVKFTEQNEFSNLSQNTCILIVKDPAVTFNINTTAKS